MYTVKESLTYVQAGSYSVVCIKLIVVFHRFESERYANLLLHEFVVHPAQYILISK